MSPSSPRVFTPFIRRFTDQTQPRTILPKTVKLYQARPRPLKSVLTGWALWRPLHRSRQQLVEKVTEVVELPDYVPLGEVS